jgi:hypothetical protein
MSKIEDLNKVLFDQLNRLNDTENMKNPIALERELKRTGAISDVAKQIIDTAKTELGFMKQLGVKENHFTGENSIPALDQAQITPRVNLIEDKKAIASRLDQQLLDDDKKQAGDNLEGKTPVKIDDKTTIFIKSGEDPEAAKKRYFENLHKRGKVA